MDQIRSALGQIVAFIPALVAGLIVFGIGWVVAALVARGLRAVLPRMGFDAFLARHHLTERSPAERTGSRGVATFAFWVILLVGLMQAANIWGLAFVSGGLATVIAYVPNVIAAVVLFSAAYVAGNWVRDRLCTSSASAATTFGSAGALLPSAVRAGILTLGAFVALRQLNIAPEILLLAFGIVFGAIALAMALAFGLGGRRTVERMTMDWYDGQRSRRATSMPVSATGNSGAEPITIEGEQPPGIH